MQNGKSGIVMINYIIIIINIFICRCCASESQCPACDVAENASKSHVQGLTQRNARNTPEHQDRAARRAYLIYNNIAKRSPSFRTNFILFPSTTGCCAGRPATRYRAAREPLLRGLTHGFGAATHNEQRFQFRLCKSLVPSSFRFHK